MGLAGQSRSPLRVKVLPWLSLPEPCRERERVAKEAKAHGAAGAMGIRADATRREEQRAAVRRVIDSFGRLNVLVNNAGGVVAPRGLQDRSVGCHSQLIGPL